MKKRGVAALFLAGITCLAGCGFERPEPQPAASENAERPVTSVKFWTYCTTPERDLDFESFKKVLSEKYPEISLDYTGFPGDIPTFAQKLDVAIASDTAPDMTDYYDSKYIRNGFYEPLDAYLDNWQDKDSLDPSAVERVRRYDPAGKALYAIPFSTQPWGMWVRKDLLKAAGLKVPDTWEDFFAAVPRLTDQDAGRYGIAIRGGPGSSNTLEALMYSYSGLTEYFDENGRCTINNPKNVEFVERYLGFYNRYSAKDDLVKGWTQLSASFQAGKAAIIFHNFGSGPSMDEAFHKDDSRYQAVGLPKSAGGKRSSRFVLVRCVGMNSKSRVKEQAFQAMTVYCGGDVQIRRCKTQGEVPADRKAVSSAEYLKDARPYMELAARISTERESPGLIDVPVYLPEYTEIQTEMEPLIQKVMTGKTTAKAMLDLWAEKLEAARAEFESRREKTGTAADGQRGA